MRSPSCITRKELKLGRLVLLGCILALICCGPVAAQRIAVIVPDEAPLTKRYGIQLSELLSKKFNVLDDSMSLSAFRSIRVENPFNLTRAQAMHVGEVVGCDHFLLIRSSTLRRTSFAKDEFYESYITGYLVSGRSGRLIHWTLKKFEADTPGEAERMLFAGAGTLADEMTARLEDALRRGPTVTGSNPIEEVPDDGSAAAKNVRPPLPYKRIKPDYTREAYLYDIRATVDALVDIDENGSVIAVEIDRWGGFGLDGSVADTIRKMNWRPAERSGKKLPMRVLLRYNFTKIEKD